MIKKDFKSFNNELRPQQLQLLAPSLSEKRQELSPAKAIEQPIVVRNHNLKANSSVSSNLRSSHVRSLAWASQHGFSATFGEICWSTPTFPKIFEPVCRCHYRFHCFHRLWFDLKYDEMLFNRYFMLLTTINSTSSISQWVPLHC